MRIRKFNESSDEGIDIRDIMRKGKYIPDGVWDISDIEYVSLIYPHTKKYVPGENNMRGNWIDIENKDEIIKNWEQSIISFIEKYPDYAVADAYQTETPFLLSKLPTKSVDYKGSGFNHGSNNIIDNCPTRILICGEDD